MIENIERMANDPNRDYLDGYDIEDDFIDESDAVVSSVSVCVASVHFA
jgi:hypothetical protein